MRRAVVILALAALGLVAATAQAQPPPVIPLPAPAAGPSVTYIAEELITGPLSSEVLARMAPLHSIAAVEEMLKAGRIPFSWRVGELSMAKAPPAFSKQLASLPPGEPFVVPQANGVVIGVILSARRD